MRVVGIDPGINGAIACIGMNGEFISVHDMPTVSDGKAGKRRVAILELESILYALKPKHIYIERVRGMNKGGTKQGASRSFNFGMSYGIVKAVVQLNNPMSYDIEVQSWKRYFKLWGKHKKDGLVLARRMYPEAELHLVKHQDRADALLIARYGLIKIHG